MCGIAGFVGPFPDPDAARGALQQMTDVLRHRGPDGEGTLILSVDGGRLAGLGHRRLAIIDPEGGAQPVRDERSGVAMTYNGELYNYKDLRLELTALGQVFSTSSDTEVVLKAFAQWGVECFRRFRGMFALAIWDPRTRTLVLARDHFGKKPLFYRQIGQRLYFGSEPKVFLATGEPPPSIDVEALGEFLSWRYVPAPHTLFEGVRKLAPGCMAVWDGRELTETRYFTPPYAEPAVREIPERPVEAFLAELEEAVRLRMVSDAPFGAFLSGGLDSSAVVALMSRHASGPVRTFAVGFAEAEHSELPYAKLVADRFETDHTELVISASDLIEHLPALIEKSDGPVSEPSNIPIWLLSREAAKSVKMILTGEGSDELLGGYPKHSAERFGALWRSAVPPLIHSRLVQPATDLLPYRFRRVKTAVASMGLREDRERLPRWMGTLTPQERNAFMGRVVRPRPPAGPLFSRASGRTALERALLFDQASWLPDNLLERGDRMTMAASIEARMPFMDTRLAAFAAKLTDAWRIRGSTSKYILRAAMADLLPEQILRRPKVGFRVPVEQWFRRDMREFLRDHLDSAGSLTRGLYAKGAVTKVLDEHQKGVRNHEKLLWSLLNLELFQKRYRLPEPASGAS